MKKELRLDFILDFNCFWSAINLNNLAQAAKQVKEVKIDIHYQPYELYDIQMDQALKLFTYLKNENGWTQKELEALKQKVQAANSQPLLIKLDDQTPLESSFDRHRLLLWAQSQQDDATDFVWSLFKQQFKVGSDVNDFKTLSRLAGEAGLNEAEALEVLQSGRYANRVLETQAIWSDWGIVGVPVVIINHEWVLEGLQSTEDFIQILKEV